MELGEGEPGDGVEYSISDCFQVRGGTVSGVVLLSPSAGTEAVESVVGIQSLLPGGWC